MKWDQLPTRPNERLMWESEDGDYRIQLVKPELFRLYFMAQGDGKGNAPSLDFATRQEAQDHVKAVTAKPAKKRSQAQQPYPPKARR